MMKRTMKTKSGRTVKLDELTKVNGGWTGYVVGTNQYAVKVFIPGN
jgi:hypothetical protein